ncbi:MAG: DUF1574 domain-containing protein [Nodosilinea sp.]
MKAALGQPEAVLHSRLRGNILHVLCETLEPLEQTSVLLGLVRYLLENSGHSPLGQAYPQVYQLYLYSRRLGETKPDWTAPIYLNRLERHLAQLVLDHQDGADLQAAQVLLEDYTRDHPDLLATGDVSGRAMVLSNLSLARRGDPEAIAWYLSETLSGLDVGVWVSIKAIPGLAHLHRPEDPLPGHESYRYPTETDGCARLIPRLWILCEATYSPDPGLIARPTAERLRSLHLTQYKDAVLLLQVRGETKPDWSLRIDLTPAEEMLREWGRWGDVDALARLLSLALNPHGLTATATISDGTLHAFCHGSSPPGDLQSHPSQDTLLQVLTPLLEDLAPQGVGQAIFYGPTLADQSPDWVHYLSLPAAEHSDLADTPEYLGQLGDLPALAFLLTRQLNPNLDDRLATGGMRVQLLVRDRLLHVMVDSPLLPQRRLIAPALRQYLEDLSPAGLEGVRIYGRRSGQAQPAWSYGRDFRSRHRLVPESTPEFTASHAYVNDLLVKSEQPFTPVEAGIGLEAGASGLQNLGLQNLCDRSRRWLLRSQLFSDHATSYPLASLTGTAQAEGFKIALVWSAVGLLIALQLDWVVGQVLTSTPNVAKAETLVVDGSTDQARDAKAWEDALATLDWPQGAKPNRAPGNDLDSFLSGVNVGSESRDLPLMTTADQPMVDIDKLVAASSLPSFNSQQLNEKVALYRQRLKTTGPADVMIVGSSRALRGVDPVALRKQLATLGYADINIFNFGINGATAQVVDLVIRQILTPQELPKLILWADGARAFNSGREDVTYNAIVASPGYRELMANLAKDGQSGNNQASAPQGAQGASLTSSYKALDQGISDRLGYLSATYDHRGELKTWLQDRLAVLAGPTPTKERLDAPMPAGSAIDFDGFLPLSVRFNPATYYQTYARVSGNYDGDYDGFRLEGEQSAAFAELIRFTQRQKIPIVFINTPLTDEYLDEYRQQAETEFRQHMVTLSTRQAGFLFRDLGQAWPQRYDYFSDPSHLNRYGAYQVSQRLAQDPLIAWPRLPSPSSP